MKMIKYLYSDKKTGLHPKTFSSLKELLKDAFNSNDQVHWKMSIKDEIVINKLYNTTDCVQIYGFIPGSGPVDEFVLAEEIRSNLEKLSTI